MSIRTANRFILEMDGYRASPMGTSHDLSWDQRLRYRRHEDFRQHGMGADLSKPRRSSPPPEYPDFLDPTFSK